MEEQIFIKTSSLNLAATLLSLGHDILGINDTRPQQSMFLFEHSEKVSRDIDRFWEGGVLVEPKVLFYNRHELVTRLKESSSKGGVSTGG